MPPNNAHPGAPGMGDPAGKAAEVTLADDSDLADVSRALYVGSAGDVAVHMADLAPTITVTFRSVPAGTILPIRVKRVLDTGTTASEIVNLY